MLCSNSAIIHFAQSTLKLKLFLLICGRLMVHPEPGKVAKLELVCLVDMFICCLINNFIYSIYMKGMHADSLYVTGSRSVFLSALSSGNSPYTPCLCKAILKAETISK